MTIIALQFTAELVKLIDFRAADDFENQGRFTFEELMCENCEGIHDNNFIIEPFQLYVMQDEDKDIHVHGRTMCRFCENIGFIQMRRDLGNNYEALTVELSRAGKYATIMHFKIKGFKPNKCNLIGKFVATAEVDNRKINDIAFANGSSYIDGENSGAAVLNQNLRFTIVEDDIDTNSSSSAG